MSFLFCCSNYLSYTPYSISSLLSPQYLRLRIISLIALFVSKIQKTNNVQQLILPPHLSTAPPPVKAAIIYYCTVKNHVQYAILSFVSYNMYDILLYIK
jgi:hypothetical protein